MAALAVQRCRNVFVEITEMGQVCEQVAMLCSEDHLVSLSGS